MEWVWVELKNAFELISQGNYLNNTEQVVDNKLSNYRVKKSQSHHMRQHEAAEGDNAIIMPLWFNVFAFLSLQHVFLMKLSWNYI